MAIASDHWELTINLIDNGALAFSKQVELVAADYAAAAANATAYVSDLASATDCEISGYRLTEIWLEDTVVVPTALNAQKEMQARIVVQLATSPLKKAVLDIPGPKETLFVGAVGTTGYDIVDVADSFVVNLIDNYRAAGGPTATLSDGEAALAGAGGIVRGRRVHRKSGLQNPG